MPKKTVISLLRLFSVQYEKDRMPAGGVEPSRSLSRVQDGSSAVGNGKMPQFHSLRQWHLMVVNKARPGLLRVQHVPEQAAVEETPEHCSSTVHNDLSGRYGPLKTKRHTARKETNRTKGTHY